MIIIIIHVIYYIRGADDDMRKEDCISSESRLLLGPVVEISNLKFFDNLVKKKHYYKRLEEPSHVRTGQDYLSLT